MQKYIFQLCLYLIHVFFISFFKLIHKYLLYILSLYHNIHTFTPYKYSVSNILQLHFIILFIYKQKSSLPADFINCILYTYFAIYDTVHCTALTAIFQYRKETKGNLLFCLFSAILLSHILIVPSQNHFLCYYPSLYN